MTTKIEGHIVALQVGDGKVEVYKNISDDECVRVIAKKAPAIAENLRLTNARISAIHERVLPDPDYLVEYYLLQHAQTQTDKLLNLDLEDMKSDEAQKRIDEYHLYTSIGSTMLYKDVNYGGKSKFFTVTWPNFKWSPYRFNDQASSAKAWGGNILFQHTWYRGRRLYLVGLPFFQHPRFSDFEFNDIASSFVSIP